MMKLIIAIDFDGTIAETDFPTIIALRPHAAAVINKLAADGHTIIVHSCRANKPAQDMKAFLDTHGIRYHHINENSPDRIKIYGYDTRKISADIYIDDHNLDCKGIYWPEVYYQIQMEIAKLQHKKEEIII